MENARLRPLPYPALLHRLGKHYTKVHPHPGACADPLDNLARRIADQLDAPIVEVLDARTDKTVLTGRCVASVLDPHAGFQLHWSARSAIGPAGHEKGMIIVRDRAGRKWANHEQCLLDAYADEADDILMAKIGDAPTTTN